MASALNFKSSGPGSNPGRDITLCFWERQFTLTVSLHPGVKIGTSEFNAATDWHPIQGGVGGFLVT